MQVALFDAHGNQLTVRRPAALMARTLGADGNFADRLLCRLQFPKDGRYWSAWRCFDNQCAGFCRITVEMVEKRRTISYIPHVVTDEGFDLRAQLRLYRPHAVMNPGLSDTLAQQIAAIIMPDLENCLCPLRRFA